jgi:hypothetical protein
MCTRVQRSGHRLAIMQAMLLEEICDLLTLGEAEATIGAISTDLHAKKLSGGP